MYSIKILLKYDLILAVLVFFSQKSIFGNYKTFYRKVDALCIIYYVSISIRYNNLSD